MNTSLANDRIAPCETLANVAFRNSLAKLAVARATPYPTNIVAGVPRPIAAISMVERAFAPVTTPSALVDAANPSIACLNINGTETFANFDRTKHESAVTTRALFSAESFGHR